MNDAPTIQTLLEHAAIAAGATVVQSIFHKYRPHGVTGIVIIEESHLSIHTWPETGYAAVDFYTCGGCVPQRAHEVLKAKLNPVRSEIMVVERGLPGTHSLALRTHHLKSHSENKK